MKKRLITGIAIAIVYIATILLTIYVHEIFFDVLVIILAITAGLEMSSALSRKFGKALDGLIVCNTVVGYIAFYLVHHVFGSQSGGITAYFGVLAAMFIICIVFTMISKRYTMRNAVSTMLVMVYPVSILVYMLGLNYLDAQFRIAGIILVFIVSSFTDTFAYIVGSLVKGAKLCPRISPKKTISGAVGGLLGGIFGGALVLLFSVFNLFGVQQLSSSMGFNVMHFLLLGLFGSLFDQIGDLVASYLKRSCGIKDFGNLLPGHGGVLDRIDGLMLNSVFVFVYMTALMIL